MTLLTPLLHLKPPINLPIPPNLSLTLPVSRLMSCFAIQYEHNKYIVIIFDVSK